MLEIDFSVRDERLQTAISHLEMGLADWSGAWPGLAEAVQAITATAPQAFAAHQRAAQSQKGKPRTGARRLGHDFPSAGAPVAVLEASATSVILGPEDSTATQARSLLISETSQFHQVRDNSPGFDLSALCQPMADWGRKAGVKSGFAMSDDQTAPISPSTAIGQGGLSGLI